MPGEESPFWGGRKTSFNSNRGEPNFHYIFIQYFTYIYSKSTSKETEKPSFVQNFKSRKTRPPLNKI